MSTKFEKSIRATAKRLGKDPSVAEALIQRERDLRRERIEALEVALGHPVRRKRNPVRIDSDPNAEERFVIEGASFEPRA